MWYIKVHFYTRPGEENPIKGDDSIEASYQKSILFNPCLHIWNCSVCYASIAVLYAFAGIRCGFRKNTEPLILQLKSKRKPQ